MLHRIQSIFVCSNLDKFIARDCRVWKGALEAEPVDLDFPQDLTAEQDSWLSRTQIPIRSLSFAVKEDAGYDPASAQLLTDLVLVQSEFTLQVGPKIR